MPFLTADLQPQRQVEDELCNYVKIIFITQLGSSLHHFFPKMDKLVYLSASTDINLSCIIVQEYNILLILRQIFFPLPPALLQRSSEGRSGGAKLTKPSPVSF